MPLKLTPAAPFEAFSHVPLPEVYAIITKASYSTRQKKIEFEVGYYYNEAAYVQQADAVLLRGVPQLFSQAATPEEANAVPIFQFLEQVLNQQLTALLPDVQIESVA